MHSRRILHSLSGIILTYWHQEVRLQCPRRPAPTSKGLWWRACSGSGSKRICYWQHLLPCKAALSGSGLQAFRLLVVLRPHLVSSFSPLADSLMVSHCGLTLTEKKLMFYCNTTSPMLILDSGEWGLLNGSLNYYTTLQLELFCQRS